MAVQARTRGCEGALWHRHLATTGGKRSHVEAGPKGEWEAAAGAGQALAIDLEAENEPESAAVAIGQSGEIVADLTEDGQRFTLGKGGKGRQRQQALRQFCSSSPAHRPARRGGRGRPFSF